MPKNKISTAPLNPYCGQLYYEPYTETMRRWNGKLWEETNSQAIKNDVDNTLRSLSDATTEN